MTQAKGGSITYMLLVQKEEENPILSLTLLIPLHSFNDFDRFLKFQRLGVLPCEIRIVSSKMSKVGSLFVDWSLQLQVSH